MASSPSWGDVLSGITSGNIGFKAGPGVLIVVGWIAVVGLGAAGFAGWALQSQPWLAFGAIVVILGVMTYAIERSFRYAEKNPIPALIGGAELSKLLEHQMGAKDPSIVSEGVPQIAGAAKESNNEKTAGGS